MLYTRKHAYAAIILSLANGLIKLNAHSVYACAAMLSLAFNVIGERVSN